MLWRETQFKRKTSLFTGGLLICLLLSSCAPVSDFDNDLKSIVRPYLFSFARWELKALLDEVSQLLDDRDGQSANTSDLIEHYFFSVKQIKTLRAEINKASTGNGEDNPASLEAELSSLQARTADLAATLERIIEQQIRDTLTELGIFNPADKYLRLRISFPPVNFKLEKPPYLLVISPRDRIESIREITLQTGIDRKEIADIEARVDRLDVSSLVVSLGGLGATYPTLVTNEASIQFIIDAAIEEWLHQYLSFRPLGFLYLLDLSGLSPNYEIATINETVASMVSKEIGSIIYQRFYGGYNGSTDQPAAATEFDFDAEMRDIRKMVDRYLERGEIEQAEQFMAEKRQYLATRGRYIRKLNQAYFAFHGTYADHPSSVSPIGLELKKLREQSSSLREFLNLVTDIASRQDLIHSIQ